MNRDISRDIVILAVLVSVAVHVALMFFGRRIVMTDMRAPIKKAHRAAMIAEQRGRMNDAVHFEVLPEVAPQKSAPAIEEAVAQSAAFSAAEFAPAVESAPTPDVDLPPATLAKIRPDDEAPKKLAEQILQSVSVAPPPMTVPLQSTPLLPVSAANIARPAAFNAGKLDVRLPEHPEISVPKQLAETADSRPVKMENQVQMPEFVPETVISETISHQLIEAEKAAVRNIINDGNARELSEIAEVEFSMLSNRNFRVRIVPRAGVEVMPKDVVILVDASGSIGKDRITGCRNAAKNILRTCTNTGDRFNLVAFRDRYTYAFKEWKACTVPVFNAADKWLDRLAAHGRTDFFASITSVLTLPRDPKRPLIALVITDGDANEGVNDTEEIISRFTELNDGLISIYIYGVKSAANRHLINMLTRENRGEFFIFDGLRRESGAGIDALSERFRGPVISDLRVLFAGNQEIAISPSRLRNLYQGNSVEFTGVVPVGVRELAFSLRGLDRNGARESFFRFPIK